MDVGRVIRAGVVGLAAVIMTLKKLIIYMKK